MPYRTNFLNRWGNLNGVVSSNIYYTKYAPRFYSGHGTVLAYLTVFLFGGSVITHFLLERENKKRRNGERDHWIEGKTPAELEVVGDKRSVITIFWKSIHFNCFIDLTSYTPHKHDLYFRMPVIGYNVYVFNPS
jgi:hypothetical protein